MRETERTGQCIHIYLGGRRCSHQRITRLDLFCPYHQPRRPLPLPRPLAPYRCRSRAFLAAKAALAAKSAARRFSVAEESVRESLL
jgi:hypothetical protein